MDTIKESFKKNTDMLKHFSKEQMKQHRIYSIYFVLEEFHEFIKKK